MDENKRKPSQDLSDLKARLGLTKPAAGKPSGPPPLAGSAAATGPQPQPPQGGQPGQPAPAPRSMPIPGAAPQTATPARRDPFAVNQGPAFAQPRYQPIVDAGPLIDVPVPKKKNTSLVVGLAALGVVGLGVGYAFGRISHAGALYNRSIDDAARIKDGITKLAEVNEQIVRAMNDSRARNAGKIVYDDKLIEGLRQIQAASPFATPEATQRIETMLFHTNYSMMPDDLIADLFHYYNNSVRLLGAADEFVAHAEAGKDDIRAYAEKGSENLQRKFGIVFGEDKGTFYLGQLVEVGMPVCADKKATEQGTCKVDAITGFQVRPTSTGTWSERPGMPSGKHGGKITEIVIPIFPGPLWQEVASSQKGFIAYDRYSFEYRQMLMIAANINKYHKPLLEKLERQLSLKKHFLG